LNCDDDLLNDSVSTVMDGRCASIADRIGA